MSISALRERAASQALEFAWDSWAQMGVFAAPRIEDTRTADPEALLVFTLEVARRDPRLFDEVLDWLLENERLISVQRLRNLCRDERDTRLVGAALRWVSQFRPNPRFGRDAPAKERWPQEPLFRAASADVWNPDPFFLEFGLVRPAAGPTGKSQLPDVTRPINLALRLRLALGVSSRAEVVRFLLTGPAPGVSAQVVAEAVAFSKRNVFQTLDGLVEAELVSQLTVGNERRYAIEREVWWALLHVDRPPEYREWPQLLWAVRQLLRWLDDPAVDVLSDSMRASAARDVSERLESSLLLAGVPVVGKTLPGARYWEGFVETVDGALAALRG
ncbi:MAG: hypothetical protein U0R69_12100 [Gaiellales bacterium]